VKAIIPAAGIGRRLFPLTGAKPKALLEVGEATILERILWNLRKCGIDEVILVTGYCSEQIEALGGNNIKYIYNPSFATMGSLGSTWCARDEMDVEFIYLHSDMVFDRGILADLLKSEEDICLVIESREEYFNEDMKVKLENGRLKRIDKAINLKEADGEFIGIIKFSKAGASLLAETLNRMVREGKADTYLEDAIQQIVNEGYKVHTIDIRGKNWVEIDFIEDLERARSIFS